MPFTAPKLGGVVTACGFTSYRSKYGQKCRYNEMLGINTFQHDAPNMPVSAFFTEFSNKNHA
jgi:hypothetical protein